MKNESSRGNLNFLSSLIEVNQWELSNVPALRTVVGRHVYFSIANEMLNQSTEPSVRSIKQILKHPNFTDRAIRMKLREMEQMGWISSKASGIDKRVRFVLPTPKLEQLIEDHAKIYKIFLEKEYIMLEK